MKIAVYSRPLSENLLNYAKQLYGLLNSIPTKLFIHTNLAQQLSLSEITTTFEKATDLPPDINCLITLGGDGTLLDSVAFTAAQKIPVLGINLGRLGFLAAIPADQMKEAISQLIAQKLVTETRTMLKITCEQPLFAEMPYGLNEFTLHRRDTSSMATIHAYINNKYLNTYWADGLIVATATGSTGYSLSCGGPILSPQSANFVITPIAPHNLNVRPLVVPDNCTLSFEIADRFSNCLATLDSRLETIERSVQVNITKAPIDFELLRFAELDFLETLRTKLYWGTDKRNYL